MMMISERFHRSSSGISFFHDKESGKGLSIFELFSVSPFQIISSEWIKTGCFLSWRTWHLSILIKDQYSKSKCTEYRGGSVIAEFQYRSYISQKHSIHSQSARRNTITAIIYYSRQITVDTFSSQEFEDASFREIRIRVECNVESWNAASRSKLKICNTSNTRHSFSEKLISFHMHLFLNNFLQFYSTILVYIYQYRGNWSDSRH